MENADSSDDLVKLSKTELSARYEEELADIEKETHEEFIRREKALKRSHERRIIAADTVRKMQIKNINQMYEWEKVEAEARYKQSLAETKEKIIYELSSEVVRQSRIIDEQFAARTNMRSTSTGGSLPQAAAASTKDSQDAMAKAYQIVEGNVGGPTTSSRGRPPRSKAVQKDGSAALDKAIATDDIRSDFVKIVRDLETRNQRNEAILGVSGEMAVPVSVSIREDFVKVGPVPGADPDKDGPLGREIVYPLGSLVMIKSVLSEEQFSGVITAISIHEIIVKLGHSDARIRIYTNQLRDRRVWMCPDRELEADINLIRVSKASMDGAAAGGINVGAGVEKGSGGSTDGNGMVDKDKKQKVDDSAQSTMMRAVRPTPAAKA